MMSMGCRVQLSSPVVRSYCVLPDDSEVGRSRGGVLTFFDQDAACVVDFDHRNGIPPGAFAVGDGEGL